MKNLMKADYIPNTGIVRSLHVRKYFHENRKYMPNVGTTFSLCKGKTFHESKPCKPNSDIVVYYAYEKFQENRQHTKPWYC